MTTTDRTPITAPYSERRRPRLSLSESAEVLWGKREFHCKLRNLSAEGALFSGQFPVKKGDQIRAIFKPADLPVEMCLQGKVIDVAGAVISQFRVLFEDVPTSSKVVLRDYVRKHMPLRSPRR